MYSHTFFDSNSSVFYIYMYIYIYIFFFVLSYIKSFHVASSKLGLQIAEQI